MYQPEVVARAIVWAARGRRREIVPTLSAALAIWADRLAPGLDRYLARKARDGQQSPEPVSAGRPSNLSETVKGDYGSRGRFDDRAKGSSLSLWANQNRGWLAAGVLVAWAVWRAGVRSRHD